MPTNYSITIIYDYERQAWCIRARISVLKRYSHKTLNKIVCRPPVSLSTASSEGTRKIVRCIGSNHPFPLLSRNGQEIEVLALSSTNAQWIRAKRRTALLHEIDRLDCFHGSRLIMLTDHSKRSNRALYAT